MSKLVWGMGNGSLTRRALLRGGGAVAVATVIVSCDSSDEPGSDDGGAGGNGTSDDREAPALASLVEAGELPPLDERLPAEPLVVEPVEQVGTYGGTWRAVTSGVADSPWLANTVGYDQPVMFDREANALRGNVFDQFEGNADGTEFTVRIRPGIKWSDGTPFTADDIVFWVDDVLGNPELTPAVPAWMLGGGEPGRVGKVDEHTVTFTFTAPNALWLQNLATAQFDRADLLNHPRHYLQQFHPQHNADVDELVAEDGLADWVELFSIKADRWGNPALPTIQPWMLTSPLAESASQAVVERNPYYWKVDPDGRQLPYLDQVTFDLVADAEVMLTRALNGDIDLDSRHFVSDSNRPVLAQSQDSADYRFFDIIPEVMAAEVIALNLTHQDATKRSIFNNKDFRIGLSHAINRDEIIQAVHQGQGEPWQAAPRPESQFYDEEFAKQYTEYNPDLAAEHLDQVLPDKDADGFRLAPDGQRFSFSLEIGGVPGTAVDTAQLLKGYWQAVGIDMDVSNSERSLFTERVLANDHDATIWTGDGGNLDILLRPRWYVPTGNNFRADHAIAWASWYTSGGQAGEEPPDRVREQMNLYDQISETTNPDEQAALMSQIIHIAKEDFPVLGISLRAMQYGIVKNSFHNVPDQMVSSNLSPAPGNSEPAQYYRDGDS